MGESPGMEPKGLTKKILFGTIILPGVETHLKRSAVFDRGAFLLFEVVNSKPVFENKKCALGTGRYASLPSAHRFVTRKGTKQTFCAIWGRKNNNFKEI